MEEYDIKSTMFQPQDIVLRDDAMHQRDTFSHIETWYYDALFDNNYSVVTLVNVFKFGNQGVVLTGMFIYKDTHLVKNTRRRYLYKSLAGSEDVPLIKIKNKELIRGYIDKNTGAWLFTISMEDSDSGVDLKLIKKTTPWKGNTPLGNWLVIPRFDVQGTLRLDGKKIEVSGVGYHDHNIYPIYAPFKIRGYHFGKIAVDTDSITWARILRKHSDEHRIVVLNKDDQYLSIDPNDIRYTIKKEIISGGKPIPDVFQLQVENNHLSIDITMETMNVHQIRMPGLRYWRSHLHTVGTIRTDTYSKHVDGIEISELLKFF